MRGLRFSAILVVCAVAGGLPSAALGQWRAFVPRPLENRIFLDVFTSHERDNARSGTRSLRWRDTFVREKLTLYSDGYSYHPRLMRYRFSLAGSVKQEEYEISSLEPLGWKHASGLEYDATLSFLPEHDYNLDLWARRYEPLFKEQAATRHDSVGSSRGASFRYRHKPYFVHAGYGDDSVDSGEVSSDVRWVSADGQYLKQYEGGNELSFSGAVRPSWFSNSLGLDGSSSDYALSNFLSLRPVRLNSSLTKTTFEQQGRFAQGFESDQFTWYELLSGSLPWNFRADLSYRFQDNESKIGDAGADRRLSDRGRDVQLGLSHRLYESLGSSYTFLRGWRTSSGGEAATLAHALSLSYAKLIPHGRFLAGTSLGRSETDNRGRADVVNEPHAAIPVQESFTLGQQNVEPGSIDVFFKCPVSPFPMVFLDPVYYVATPVSNTFEIRVTALPSDDPSCRFDFVPGEAYEFFVSYSLVAGDFGLRTDSLGTNASVQLFDQMLTPYFSYATVRSQVLSGVFPGIPLDSATYTTGLVFLRGGLRVRGEYQKLDWEVSPYESWRAEVQYAASLNPTTSAYATASYLNRHYTRGTSFLSAGAFTEETTSVAGNLHKRLPARNMSLSAGGSYSLLQGVVDTNSYSLNGAWTWTIGRMDLGVGASAYASDTTGGGFVSTSRDHQLFYFRLRRRLF